jgi:hypothetical protein
MHRHKTLNVILDHDFFFRAATAALSWIKRNEKHRKKLKLKRTKSFCKNAVSEQYYKPFEIVSDLYALELEINNSNTIKKADLTV